MYWTCLLKSFHSLWIPIPDLQLPLQADVSKPLNRTSTLDFPSANLGSNAGLELMEFRLIRGLNMETLIVTYTIWGLLI